MLRKIPLEAPTPAAVATTTASGEAKEKFVKKNAISHFLAPADTKILVLLSALVERFGVSHMRDFLNGHQQILIKLVQDIKP